MVLTMPVPRMTEDEIQNMVLGLVHGRIFTAAQVPEGMLGTVFMPLVLGGLSDVDIEDVGNIVEDLSKASPWAVNGLPTFLSCRIIGKADWEIIAERARKAHEALNSAIGGDSGGA